MGLSINTNISSLIAQRNLASGSSGMDKSLQRLSTGLRINSAKDDAAGMAIATGMDAQVRGLNQAKRNANDASSLAQTAEGALQETNSILQRMRELAVQASNDTNTASDRKNINKEFSQLQSEVTSIGNNTTFNGQKLMDGSFTDKTFQIGSNADQNIKLSVGDARSTNLARHTVTAESETTVNQGTGSVRTAAADATSDNAIAAQTLIIAGSDGTKTVDVAAGASAETIANSINAESGETGVSATASTTLTLDALALDGTVSFKLNGGGTETSVQAAVTTGDLSELAKVINETTGAHNVTATESSGTLTLTNATGDNITVEDFANSSGTGGTIQATGSGETTGVTLGAGTATDSTVAAGIVELTSTKTFTASSSKAESTGSIFNVVTANSNATVTENAVSGADLLSQSNAESAIKTLDSALEFVAAERSNLGAFSNRMDSTMSNLTSQTENLSAAKSRIVDADIAAESAEMTRNSILQQAATAILAQANQQPQLALQLLG